MKTAMIQVLVLVVLAVVLASSAQAEFKHVQMTVFGMD